MFAHRKWNVSYQNVATPSQTPDFLLALEADRRCMSGEELVCSHVLPVTPQQAKTCGSPCLVLKQATETAVIKMAGNAMSVPCVGAVLLAAIMIMEPKDI